MRRLLFVGGTSDPGGLHIHTADVAQAAAALGHSVAIVSGEVDLFSNLFPRDRIPFAVDERLSWSRLRRRRLKHLAIRTVAWMSIVWRYRGYDLVLCRGAFAETPAVELLMARALGRNIYTIEHSQWLNEWPFKASKRRYGSIMNACVRRVVAVSGEIADAAIAEFGVSAGKIRICFNWPDPMFLPADTERRRQARSRLGVGADATVIGFVGRHGPEKRVEVLMEAFHRHIRPRYPGAVLVVAGDGWYRRKLERQAALCGVEADIRFV
ncbi:MAG: glycosyltransferase family 4 protein, partial [Mesorhizobium sp.]|nr:glycosyltransferase family 4 protein [Mesorhizobium sp.]